MDKERLVINLILIGVAYAMSFLIVKALEPIVPAFAFFVIVIYIFDFILEFVEMGVERVSSFRAAAIIALIGCVAAIIIGVYLTFALLDILKIVLIILLTIMIFRALHSMFLGGGEVKGEEGGGKRELVRLV